MEDASMSLINNVPSFARGCNVLVLHDDTTTLMYLRSLLEKFSFKVTCTCNISSAIKLLTNDEGKYKIIVAKATMNPISFMSVVLEKDIPIIFIYSEGFDHNLTRRSLAEGSCYFIKEPVLPKDFTELWHTIYHSQRQARGANNGERKNDDRKGKQQVEEKKKWPKSWDEVDIQFYHDYINKGLGENKRGRTIEWTPKLRKKFAEALRASNEKPSASSILKRMEEPGLTTRQVATHLKKYTEKLNRLKGAISNNYNFVTRTTPSFFGGQAISHFPSTGFTAPTGSWNYSTGNHTPTFPRELINWQRQNNIASSATAVPTAWTNQVTFPTQRTTLGRHSLASPGFMPEQTDSATGSTDWMNRESQSQVEFTVHPTVWVTPESQSAVDSTTVSNEGITWGSQSIVDSTVHPIEWTNQESQSLLDSTTFTNECTTWENWGQVDSTGFPANETNWLMPTLESQNLDSNMEYPVPAVSMDQNQPTNVYDDLNDTLLEDPDSFDSFLNGMSPDDVDQFYEPLRTFFNGDGSPHP